MSCKVDSSSLTDDSYYYSGKTGKAEDAGEAFRQAEESMRKGAEKDTTLLNNAQQKAMKLLEEYVQNIAKLSNQDYTINWIYVDNNGVPIHSAEANSTVETPEPTPAA